MVNRIATILILLLLIATGCNRQPVATTEESPPKQHATVDESKQLSITLDNEGRFAEGSSWTLTVNSDRSAALEIRTFPDSQTRIFTLTVDQMDALRSTLEAERFFDLADKYGEVVPDGSTRTITVQLGDTKKTVELNFLMNWVHSEPDKLVEPARAVRIWRHCREWFSDDEAVDLGRFNQMVLDAVADR